MSQKSFLLLEILLWGVFVETLEVVDSGVVHVVISYGFCPLLCHGRDVHLMWIKSIACRDTKGLGLKRVLSPKRT